ncbi:hypothetical protein AB0L64_05100 [Kribbella sp. NPDC051936]|uniref:hypothetical protein n=1 Tax=Kribbella sp. NPDC051936 TaxID=3154946 RepID=UPI0034205087
MKPGQLCRVVATFIEDRNGRALVRLPNGSKTSIPYDAIESRGARAHFIPAQDGSTVTVLCLDDDWSGEGSGFLEAAKLLLAHVETH